MSPLVAYHATAQRHRENILRYGLIPHQPTRLQPWGVYVYRPDREFDHNTGGKQWRPSGVRWVGAWPMDVWQVSYIGPVCADQFVMNGWVLFEQVQPAQCRLLP